jgi:putative transposase
VHAQDEAKLEIEIKAAHERTRGTFGPERLQQELAGHAVKVGISRIKKIRKKLGICCKQIKKYKGYYKFETYVTCSSGSAGAEL